MSGIRGDQQVRVVGRAAAPRVDLADHHAFDGRELYRSADGSTVLSAVMDGGGSAEEHVHERLTHVFTVLEGELVVGTAGSGEKRVGVDETIVIPAGIPHYTQNRGESRARYVAVSLTETPS